MFPQFLQLFLGLYFVLGVIVAIGVLLFRLTRLDPSARQASPGFKALIFPGLVALWPLFAARWIRGAEHPPTEMNGHRRAATAGETRIFK